MKAVNAKVNNSTFTNLNNFILDLLFSFGDYFFYPGWMNSTISN